MSDTESPMQVMCGTDDASEPDCVSVTTDYLNLLLTLAYPNDGAHCPSCKCRTE